MKNLVKYSSSKQMAQPKKCMIQPCESQVGVSYNTRSSYTLSPSPVFSKISEKLHADVLSEIANRCYHAWKGSISLHVL